MALQALNRSSPQEFYGSYSLSTQKQKISEAEYWKKYYNSPDAVYE